MRQTSDTHRHRGQRALRTSGASASPHPPANHATTTADRGHDTIPASRGRRGRHRGGKRNGRWVVGASQQTEPVHGGLRRREARGRSYGFGQRKGSFRRAPQPVRAVAPRNAPTRFRMVYPYPDGHLHSWGMSIAPQYPAYHGGRRDLEEAEARFLHNMEPVHSTHIVETGLELPLRLAGRV